MPENLKVLRGRIRSIKKTKKITRAMEMVSAAKLRKTESVMKAIRPFIAKIRDLLGRLALSSVADDHPLFQVSQTGVPVLVVFTSDRGLCGAFNANILKQMEKRLKENSAYKIIVLGRKGRDYVRKHHPAKLIKEYVDLGGNLDAEVTDAIGEELLNGFMEGRYSQIDLVHAHFISTASNKPVAERYLPMSAAEFGVEEADAGNSIDYILEPSPERVFDAILPRFLKTKIYLTQAESLTAEYSSRMMAMNAATKNCTELSEALTLRLNKARQAAITTEIIEIVSGAQAL